MNDQPKGFSDATARLAELTDIIIDQIRKLAELHADGILSDDEFIAKKTELLSRF